MKETVKISVIVPVYNAEKYLRQCLDSIIQQSLRDIEIIVIENGSTDGSPAICEEYAQQDKRIKLICEKQNIGLGKANNKGLAAATGEYISFVESDDWLEPDAYKQLYVRTQYNNYDIVKGFYNSVWDDDNRKCLEENFISSEVDTPLLERGQCFHLISRHVSHWSAIYRRDFLIQNNINFNSTPGGASQDFGFAVLCYAYAQKVYIVPRALVNYRVFTGNHAPAHLNRTIIHECLLTYRRLLAGPVLPAEIWERIYARIATRILPIRGIPLYTAWELRQVLHIGGATQTYQYISALDQKRIRKLVRYKWVFRFLSDLENKYRIFGITVFKKTRQKVRQGIKTKTYVLGIPFYKKIETQLYKEKYFCGILYSSRSRALEILYQQNKELKHDVASLKTDLEAVYLHPKTFGLYRNSFRDKNVVLVCTGPTAQYYTTLKNAIHVGVNGAIYLQHVPLDFLFVQDNTLHQNDQGQMNIDAFHYRGNKCQKFFGTIGNFRLNQVRPKIERLSAEHFDSPSVHRYILGDNHNIAYDCSFNPIGDVGGTSFSALQFILYTHPKRLYLVGWDCGTGYFYGKTNAFGPANYQVKVFKEKFLPFISLNYPNLEIVSINPVGLKGLFKDVYTESYLKEHPEIQDVEILK